MEPSKSSVDWIQGYMDWTQADSWTFGPDRLAPHGPWEAGVDRSGSFAPAYLEWMDSWQQLRESICRDDGSVSAGRADGFDDYEGGPDMLWDAYMVAAHTDSDCMPFLRRIMDAGKTTPRVAIPA